MKLLITFFGSLAMLVSCKSQQQSLTDSQKRISENFPTIYYEAHTRGAYKTVTIDNAIVSVVRTLNGTPETKELATKDRNELIMLLSKVDLNNMKNLKAPSEARAYDGALHAVLKVTEKDNVYESNFFDHGNPPTEIADFVNKVVAIGNIE